LGAKGSLLGAGPPSSSFAFSLSPYKKRGYMLFMQPLLVALRFIKPWQGGEVSAFSGATLARAGKLLDYSLLIL